MSSVPADSSISLPPPAKLTATPAPAVIPDRRADTEAKHVQVAAIIKESQVDGLLVLDPENVAWLTGGLTPWGILAPTELPALYYNPDQRWLLACNIDSQRLFDEEIAGLGFQLKEWQWHWGRQQLLADLCSGRKVACDRPMADCPVVGEQLRQLRRILTPLEITTYRELGRIISHALEAACRSVAREQTEQEVAGNVAHRLTHRGVEPLAIEVAADGRSGRYHRCGPTAAKVQQYCVVQATGRQAGLVATASRTMSFGPAPEELRKEHDAVSKVTATYIAASWPDGVPHEILAAGRRIYQICGYEHDWRFDMTGSVTGRSVAELPLNPQTTDLIKAGWGLRWRATAGAAVSCDTYVVTAEGPRSVTSMGHNWPQKRIKIQGGSLGRPDILQR
jgi:Xaa-Pro aminopeptidase